MTAESRFRQFILEFQTHPASAGQTYFQHLSFATGFSLRLFALSLAALLHAVVPPLCSTTVSRQIVQLHNKMHQQVSRQEPD